MCCTIYKKVGFADNIPWKLNIVVCGDYTWCYKCMAVGNVEKHMEVKNSQNKVNL